jgi:hypothetical protein
MGSTIKTATGNVNFATCRFYYDRPQPVFQRLADLHNRALGAEPPFATPVVNTFTPLDAFQAYSDASVSLLAQLAVSSPSGQVAMLGDIVAAAERLGSLDGLEGVFLSAARAAQYVGAGAELGNAAEMFQSLGIPGQLGGGARTSAIMDVGTGLLSFVIGTDIGAALSAGTSGWTGSPTITMNQLGVPGAAAGLAGLNLLFSGALPGLDGPSDGPGLEGGHVGPSPELTGDIAEQGFKVGGAIGTLVGGVTSGGGGAALGGALGGAAGYLVGWAVEKLDTPYVAPAPDAHDGNYGPYGPFIQPYIGANHGSTTPTGRPIPAPSEGHPPASNGPEEKKTIKPGDSTKSPVDDGGGGSLNAATGAGWFPARAPYGDGMAAFAVQQHEALLLIGLPRYDDDGAIQLDGYFPIDSINTSGIPSQAVLRGRLTSPTAGRGTDVAGGNLNPALLGTGPSSRLTIPARVDGVVPYDVLESARALFETIHKFR